MQQQNKDEVKVPFVNYTLKDWIKDSDVDGRGILFQFTDSDISILHDCIHQIVNEEEKKLIDELKTFTNPKADIFNEFCCPLCMFKKQLLDKLDSLAVNIEGVKDEK